MGGLIVRKRSICCLQGAGDDYRLLIQRPHATAVFSGDFDHGKSRADPLSSLQRTFAGSIVPLEVFAVNNSTLSPHQLCEYLQRFNPGEAHCLKHESTTPAEDMHDEAVADQAVACSHSDQHAAWQNGAILLCCLLYKSLREHVTHTIVV